MRHWPLLFISAFTLTLWQLAPLSQAQEAAIHPALLEPYTEAIADTRITFDMVPIPGGVFTMGSPPGEAGRSDDEGPQHEVTVAPFYMGRLEVTWNEFDEFAFSLDLKRQRRLGLQVPREGAAAVSRPTPPYADEAWGWGKDRQPVVGITQYAAAKYCEWLSAKTGRRYRLPTEAEWEYAARAGSATAYGFGDDPSALTDHAWFRANSGGQPHPGGQKAPNAWGLYDMHGNVAEWTADIYDPAVYARRKAGSDTPDSDEEVDDADELRYPHAVRGGSWNDDAAQLRSAARLASTEAWSRRDPQIPKSRWWHTDATFVGFRVVREMEP